MILTKDMLSRFFSALFFRFLLLLTNVLPKPAPSALSNNEPTMQETHQNSLLNKCSGTNRLGSHSKA